MHVFVCVCVCVYVFESCGLQKVLHAASILAALLYGADAVFLLLCRGERTVDGDCGPIRHG